MRVVPSNSTGPTRSSPARAMDRCSTRPREPCCRGRQRLAPLHRAASLFAPALRSGARVLLYKGPDAATEIAEAAPETAKRRLRMRIVARYELPDALGTRTIVEMARVA